MNFADVPWLPNAGELRDDPLECDFGDGIRDSIWGERMFVSEFDSMHFFGTLFDPTNDEARKASPYRNYVWCDYYLKIGPIEIKAWRRVNMEAFQEHRELGQR